MVWGGNVLEQREGMLQGSFDEYCDLYNRKRDEPIRDIVWHFVWYSCDVLITLYLNKLLNKSPS